MRMLFHILFAVLSLVIAGVTFHAFFEFLRDPTAPELFKAYPRHRSSRRERWLSGLYTALVFIGFGVVLYSAAASFLSWIPRSWVHVDDDGGREWVGHGIALFIAIFGSVALLQGMSNVADKMRKRDAEIAYLKQEYERLSGRGSH